MFSVSQLHCAVVSTDNKSLPIYNAILFVADDVTALIALYIHSEMQKVESRDLILNSGVKFRAKIKKINKYFRR